MTLIWTIFNQNDIALVFTLIAQLFMFFALGLIQQDIFNFKKSNKFISIPLGFLWYMLLTWIIYIPLILIPGTSYSTYKIVEILKNLLLFFFIFILYKRWKPSLGVVDNWYKTIPMTGLIVGLNLYLYFFLWNSYADIGAINTSTPFYEGINNLFSSNLTVLFETSGSGAIGQHLNHFQSTYYWLTYMSLSSGDKGLSLVFTKQYPALIVITCSLLITSVMVDSEKSIISFIFGLLVSLALTTSLVYIGPGDKAFYSIWLLVLAIYLMIDLSFQQEIERSSTYLLIFIGFALQSTTSLSLVYLLLFGGIGIVMSILKDGTSLNILFWYLFTIFLQQTLFAVLGLLSTSIVSYSLTYLIIFFVVSSIILIPLYSYKSSNLRRRERAKFEEKNRISFTSNTLLISSFFIFISILWMSGIQGIFVDHIEAYFGDQFQFWVLMYFLLVLIPSIVLIVLKEKLGYSSLLTALAYTAIVFNPITIIFIVSTLGLSISFVQMLLVGLTIVIIWAIALIRKQIPTKWRY